MKDTAADGSALPSIILGLTDKGHLREFTFEKNLLSVAGAGAGKGATQIILNLRHGWEHNAVVIDPSGEAAEAAISWRDQRHDKTAWNYRREIAVIDPYKFANVPDFNRASFNPLDLVESAADLRNLASGLITRTDTDKGHWVDSAEDVAAGLLAFILQDSELEDDERHIGQLRHYIGTLSDPATKAGTIEAMKSCEGYGGLAMDIAKRLSPDNTETQNILGTLRTQTRWLNSEEVVEALSVSQFKPTGGKPTEMGVTCHWSFIQLPPEPGGHVRLSARVEQSPDARSFHLAQRGGRLRWSGAGRSLPGSGSRARNAAARCCSR